MKIYLKKIILNVFKKIQFVLTLIKYNILPKNPTFEEENTPYKLHQKKKINLCYNHFSKYFDDCLFLDEDIIRKYAIVKSIKENDPKQEMLYLEFGVYVGSSINYFSLFTKKIYGFDSFAGLKEDWVGNTMIEGTFDLKQKIPPLNKNVIAIKGWIQDTLPPFLNEKKEKINFVHIDVDTYETTKFILNHLKPRMNKNSIIIFDELYNHIGWDKGEYQALQEVYKENEYKFLAFSKEATKVVIQIL